MAGSLGKSLHLLQPLGKPANGLLEMPVVVADSGMV